RHSRARGNPFLAGISWFPACAGMTTIKRHSLFTFGNFNNSAQSTPMTAFNNYIAGEWVAGASNSAYRNPSDLSDVIGDYAQADAAQTRTAIGAAKKAFPGWAVGSIQERANMLDRVGNEI